MRPPQVLVFLDWYRPGFQAGGPVRSMVNLAERLQGRVQFHIATRNTDYRSSTPYPEIEPDRWTPLPTGEQVYYASAAGIRKARWRSLLRERDWDAVYINGIYSWWFSIVPLWLSRSMDVKRIVAVRGMLAPGPMRHGRSKKRAFLALARTLGLYRGVHFHATTEAEADEVRKWIDAHAQVTVVPNLPRAMAAEGMRPRIKVAGELTLVSLARIAVEKNTHLALEALRGVHGKVSFHLFGAITDETYWQRCLGIIAELPENLTVHHRGVADAEDVPSLLQGYHALLLPSAGENFGHALLEALAAGVPLVVSDRTPWRGLEEDHAGWDIPLGNMKRFTQVLQQLVDMDQQAYDRWQRGAFARAGRYLAGQDAEDRMLALFTT
ncbi:MAG: glycosyltransferase family 4 protein [Flavobacteriales bacterium]|nr:glycosyltransferase family 4 protein [Flavobacteriales bacterium]